MRDAPRRRPSALPFTLAVVAMCVSAFAVPPAWTQPTSTTPGSSTWVTAVDAYAAGDAGAGLVLLPLDAGSLLAAGRREIASWQAQASEVSRRRLRVSAVLALELAIAHAGTPDKACQASYMDLAETSLRALERGHGSPETERFAAMWRLAQLQLLLASGEVGDIETLARRDDAARLPATLQAEWHVARGIGAETASRMSIGTTRVQQTPFGTTAIPRHLWMERTRRRAVDHYRAAIQADAGHAEARVRLGRVLLESGQHQEARQHLERAATNGCQATVCGFAWLFLGDWHMRHGTPEGARRAFTRASAVLEIRQSALLGLLAATLASRPGAAVELTRQFDAEAMLGRQTAADGWSRYLAGQPFGVGMVSTALRDEARR